MELTLERKQRKEAILQARSRLEEMDYDEWVLEMEKANEPVLLEFQEYLEAKGLAKKTVDAHVNNIALFADTYQTRYDYCGTIFDGWNDFGDFVGYFFVRKCLWATASSLRGLVASLKKFYIFLAESSYIQEEESKEALLYLKEGLEDWLEDLRDFDEGSGDWF